MDRHSVFSPIEVRDSITLRANIVCPVTLEFIYNNPLDKEIAMD
jgi:hypothetical protein